MPKKDEHGNYVCELCGDGHPTVMCPNPDQLHKEWINGVQWWCNYDHTPIKRVC